MAEDGRVVIKITGDTKGYDDAMKSIGVSTGKAAGQAKKDVKGLDDAVAGVGATAGESANKACARP